LNVGSDDSRFDFKKNLELSCGRLIPWEEVDVDRRSYYGRMMSMTAPFPGIVSLIKEARDRGLKLAVASSSPDTWVRPLLEQHDLAASFDFIVTAENGLAAKPEPDVYRHALSLLGVSAERALAFEDSPNGLLAARRAGITCVIIPNRVTKRLAFDRPDLVLRPRRVYSLERIIAQVGDHR
jgi:HAD superfamily hydrolase (TIGR01509 family)